MESIQWTSSMIFFTKERSFLPWKETSYTPIQSAIWKVNRLVNPYQPIILDIRISNLTDEHTHNLCLVFQDKKATERAISIRKPFNTGGNIPIETKSWFPLKQTLFPLKYSHWDKVIPIGTKKKFSGKTSKTNLT